MASAEREPITGVYSGVQGRAPGRGVRGRSTPEAETLLASECSIETAKSPIFLKF